MGKEFDNNLQHSISTENSLSEFSHIKIGGKIEYLFAPKSLNELASLIEDAFKARLKIVPIGGASNVLFGNIRKRVIILDKNLPQACDVNGNEVVVSSNYEISKFIDKMKGDTLGGLEFLSGIPAHIGGAVSMNAGAFGKEISNYIQSVEVIDEEGNIQNFHRDKLKFRYRRSSIKGFITKVHFILEPKPKEEIETEVAKIMKLRKYKHPYDYPSLGSTFKNPDDMSAASLIEECGLKGKQQGDAQISEKHANFIVNKGNATFDDVIYLINLIQAEIYKKKNILLNLEIKVLN